MCPRVRVRACVCVSVLARAQKQGSRWFGQVLPGNDSSSSSSSSKASGPRILAPRDRGIGGKAEPPSVSDGPLSSPWEPALELGRARPGRQEIAESSGTASPAYPSGVSAGDPALLYPPSSGYPRKSRDRELRAPPELLPTPWPTTTAETWEPAQQVRTGASPGVGPGTKTYQPPPPRPGLANGRQGGRAGGKDPAVVAVAAAGGWGVCGGDPIVSSRLHRAVWQGLGRERQGAGGGAGKGPGWFKEGGTRPGGTGARPLWVESSPSIPHPSQPRCLPGALPSSPVSCRGSALKLRTREGPEREVRDWPIYLLL